MINYTNAGLVETWWTQANLDFMIENDIASNGGIKLLDEFCIELANWIVAIKMPGPRANTSHQQVGILWTLTLINFLLEFANHICNFKSFLSFKAQSR